MQSEPLHSLIDGSWFKLICGASYQHLPAVRSLALAYSLAGADCIDVAADSAVIAAAIEGIKAAEKIQKENLLEFNQNQDVHQTCSLTPGLHNQSTKNKHAPTQVISPWLMVSVNDGEDPHFRKAKFDSTHCPQNCPQPCVKVCPAAAIDLSSGGVIDDLCYGCGRCLPVCPEDLIDTRSHRSSISSVVSWVESMAIDAIEIHTQVGHFQEFKQVWQELSPVVQRLKILAISCTDAPGVIDYLRSLYKLISPLPCPLIWQTDGRSMSGDIGKGTTHAAIAFAQKALQAKLSGYIQLAGGTNGYTVDKLKQANIPSFNPVANPVAGVAYGSYARAILAPVLAQLETAVAHPIHPKTVQFNLKIQPMNQLNLRLEHDRDLLEQAVNTARELVNQLKKVKG